LLPFWVLTFGLQTSIKRYLQSASKLQRKIFVRPDILQLDPDQLLQVMKPLYGLSDAGDYWGQTLTDHHTKELRMEQATGDFSLFYKRILLDKLIGLSGTYVDDITRAGDDCFCQESTTSTQNKFDTKPIDSTPLTFTGTKIGGTPSCRTTSQERYIESL
jgi:Reverse transcriptase (RNA-dependent DNA polymerase)